MSMRPITALQLIRIGYNTRFTRYEAENVKLFRLTTLCLNGVVGWCELDDCFYITHKGWELIEEALLNDQP